MNKSESAKCFNEQIRKRWPRWTPSDVETTDWLTWLRQFDFADIARAAHKHLAESRYAKPMPYQLLEHARTIKASNSPQPNSPKRQRRDTGVPEAHTYIMCTGKDDRGRGCVGWFVPMLIWPFHKTYTADDYRRLGQQQCAIHAQRGGVWEIFTPATHLAMMQRRRKLCGTKPLDLNALQKRHKTTQTVP